MAKDLYDESDLFRKSWKYATLLKPDKIYILSAKHGLLNPNQEIDPYDITLCYVSKKEREKTPDIHVLTKEERLGWYKKVLSQLREVSDLTTDYFTILAGRNYSEGLVEHITHSNDPMDGLRSGERKAWLKQEIEKFEETE